MRYKQLFVIVFLGILVFANGLFNGFVADDIPQITENPAVQSLQSIPWFFGGNFLTGNGHVLLGSLYYKPLLYTSFSLLVALFGVHAFGFHLVQIILHIMNACLVFLYCKTFFKKWLSLLLALIFLVHPMNSEAVFYISALQEVLFFLFGMSVLLVIQHYQSKKAFFLGAFLIFCSLLSKETGILFLIIALVQTFLFNRKRFFPFMTILLPFVLLYLFLRFQAIGFHGGQAITPIEHLSLPARLVHIPLILFYYGKTALIPLNLAMSYNWIVTTIDFNHFYFPLIVDIVVLMFLILLGRFLHRNKPAKLFTLYIFFTGWLFTGLILHLQIIPLDNTVAERWFYFPMVGLLGIVGVCFEVLHQKVYKRLFVALLIALVLVFSARTISRSYDWRSDYSLASHDNQVSKDSYILEDQLAYVAFQKKQFAEVKTHAHRSVAIYPNMVNYTSLGVAYFYLGEYENANKAYRNAMKYGDYDLTYDNLAFL